MTTPINSYHLTLDKTWMQTKYLPQLSGKILFVGARPNYHTLVKTPELFESLDFDPSFSTKSISPFKHHACDFLEFENGYNYNHISLHGLWGGNGRDEFFVFNNNSDREKSKETSKSLTKKIIDSVSKAHSMLNVGGTLQIGPNMNNSIETLYNYLTDKLGYKLLDRVERIEGGCANNIFWGEKVNDNKFNFSKEDLWENYNPYAIETKGLLNG